MLSVELTYNGKTDKRLVTNTFVISLVLNDSRKEQGSCEITLSDIDRRFSSGDWQAFKGDTVEVKLGGVSFGQYAVKELHVRRSPACVMWVLSGKRRSSSKGSSPSTGKKASLNSQKMNAKAASSGIFPNQYNQAPAGLRLSGLLGLISKYTGVTLKSSLTRARKPFYTDGASSKDPDMTNFRFDASENFWNALDRICNRFGCSYHVTASTITLIERKSKKGKDVKKASVVKLTDVLDFATEAVIKPTKATATSYDRKSKKGSVATAQEGTDGTVEDLWGYKDKDTLNAMVKDSLLGGNTGTVKIRPTAGILAGGLVEVYGKTYDVMGVTYSQSTGTETMELELKAQ